MKVGGTAALARHAATCPLERYPGDVVVQAKELIFDFFGVAVAGARTDTGRVAAAVERGASAPGAAAVIGQGMRLAATGAAYVNAVSAHSLELDDVDPLALFHVHPVVVSAALAAAEEAGARGRDFLAGVLAGWEVMTRLSNAANPALRDRGFHTTPTCGVYGAAAAAARVLGLSGEQTASALGLASAHGVGLMEMYGPSMQKRINPAPAAAGGVRAALLARAGFSGADTILEGERGFLRAAAGALDPAPLTEGLGEEFPIATEFKRYACARPIHTACDAARQLRDVLGQVEPEAVADIWVQRHPAWAAYHQNPAPDNYHEAQMSLPYSVAVALVEGDAFLPQYSDEQVRRPELQALARKVRIEADPTLPTTVACRITLSLVDGPQHVVQVDHPSGSRQNPMSMQDLLAKAVRLSPSLETQLTRLAGLIERLEEVPDVTELTQLVLEGAGDAS